VVAITSRIPEFLSGQARIEGIVPAVVWRWRLAPRRFSDLDAASGRIHPWNERRGRCR
jgi:hypothetical protein